MNLSKDEQIASLTAQVSRLQARIDAWEAVHELSRSEIIQARQMIQAQERVMDLSRSELKVLRSDIEKIVGVNSRLEADILEILARTGLADEAREQMLEQVRSAEGPAFCSAALHVLVNLNLEAHQAEQVWNHVLNHQTALSKALGRHVAFTTALIDFCKVERLLSSPKVLEVAFFADLIRNTVVDELTGLYNRRFLSRAVERDMANAARHQTPIALIVGDVDHFKKINDTFGHPVGDRVLLEVASILSGESRAGDAACRMGGEEFLILAPDMDGDAAFVVAERMRRTLESKRFDFDKQVTMSFGVAAFPDFEADFDQLLLAADQALYSAKNGGRNQTVLARASA